MNAIYYHFSPGESNLENDENVGSYVTIGYINRWQRLDYVKNREIAAENCSLSYFEDAWRFFSEYNLHMYGWFVTGWAANKDVPIFSKIAEHCEQANVKVGVVDIFFDLFHFRGLFRIP